MSNKLKKQKGRLAGITKKQCVVIVFVCVVAVFALGYCYKVTMDKKQQSSEEISIDLGFGMQITEIDSYTGVFMEDGSDEAVEDIMKIIVKNNGDQNIQYAEITMTNEDEKAVFSLSTLPSGSSVILLEQNKMKYDPTKEFKMAIAENVAVFSEEPSMHEEKLEIQTLDGALNVTNTTAEKIEGDIYIYYKNVSSGIFNGGITYRAKIENGLEAGEIRQIMTNHFSTENSQLMFVTIAGE